MAFLSVNNVSVSSSSSSGTSSAKVSLWSALVAYMAGALVSFNGALYEAVSDVPAGVIPSVEAATPATPGSPRYRKLTSGNTAPEDYLSTKPYYDGQVVRYKGVLYRLDGPVSAAGTLPSSGAPWTVFGDGIGMSEFEAQELTNANLSSVNVGLSSCELRQRMSEPNRIKQHRLRLITNAAPPGVGASLATFTFPTPLRSGRPPLILISGETSLASSANFAAEPVISGSDITGYRIWNGQDALAASTTYDVCVRIDELHA